MTACIGSWQNVLEIIRTFRLKCMSSAMWNWQLVVWDSGTATGTKMKALGASRVVVVIGTSIESSSGLNFFRLQHEDTDVPTGRILRWKCFSQKSQSI